MQNKLQKKIFHSNQNISLAGVNLDQPIAGAVEWAFDQKLSLDGENQTNKIGSRINASMQLAAQGKIYPAIAKLKKLLANKNERSVVHNNLGVLYQNCDQVKRGARHFKCALNLNPNYDSALINLANYLCQQGDLAGAEVLYKQALTLLGPCPRLLANLGHCLLEANNGKEAERVFIQSIAENPTISATHFHLVRLYMMEGRIKEAEGILRLILKSEPHLGTAQRMLANCIRFTPECQDLQNLHNQFRNCPKQSWHRLHLAFALGKAYEDIQKPEKAFRMITLANGLLSRERPYQRDIQHARFTTNRRLFTPNFQHRKIPNSCQSDQRIVFLIGLPRCGSTLVHQILSMHQDVQACGESTALGNAVLCEKARDIAYNPQAIARIRDAYLHEHSNPTKVLVDKNLYNFYWAPVIFKAFPQAVVIEITRERPAHYWSLYKNYFSDGNEFTSSLKSIDEFTSWYEQLLQYWRQDNGLNLTQISYEELVTDTEKQIRKLLELCELSWEPACLEHEKSKTPVLTASACQVRQGIYNTSIKNAALYYAMIKRALQHNGIKALQG